jgi:hypothetical protein
MSTGREEFPLDALQAFVGLRTALASEPIVVYPKSDRP